MSWGLRGTGLVTRGSLIGGCRLSTSDTGLRRLFVLTFPFTASNNFLLLTVDFLSRVVEEGKPPLVGVKDGLLAALLVRCADE